MSLLEERLVYKPFKYPWAYEAWLKQQRIHWLPEEVPLAEDVKDWEKNLTAPEKNLLTQIFRFFVQADVEVNNCYMKHYSRVFKPTEVQMMLGAFSNTETIQYNFGGNWWVDKDVVVKVDYQIQDVGNAIAEEYEGLNLGLGYQF